jgi:hypothetical protein
MQLNNFSKVLNFAVRLIFIARGNAVCKRSHKNRLLIEPLTVRLLAIV